MKIKVRDKSARFTLYLPLALIKCGFVYKPLMQKYVNGDKKAVNEASGGKEEPVLTPEQLKLPKACYEILKQFKREYGQLRLIDVKTADGTVVEITV